MLLDVDSPAENNETEASGDSSAPYDTRFYKSIEEQAANEPKVRAFTEVLKKENAELRAFKDQFKAPDEYKIEDESYKNVPHYDTILTAAKDAKLNNQAVNEILKNIHNSSVNQMQEEIKQIEDFDKRKDILSNWTKATFGENAVDVATIAANAKGFKALEAIKERFDKETMSTTANVNGKIPDESKSAQDLDTEIRQGMKDKRYWKNNREYDEFYRKEIDRKFEILQGRKK